MATSRTEIKQDLVSASVQDGFVFVRLLVIQPTPFCNIDCSYCYLSTRSEKRRITLDTVEAIAKFMRDVPVANPPLTVCWHAGEPLVVPISFYEQAFQCFAATPGTPSRRQYIQTNATRINDDWCDFFKRWSVSLGVSVDGPRAIHDANRVDRSGRGTFDRVMRGISKLREHGVPFGVISVLTRDSLDMPDEMWEFYRSNGITRVAFNIDEQEGVHQTCSVNPTEHIAAYRGFMSRIAELHENDPAIEIRELKEMHRFLTVPPAAEIKRSDNRPGAILNVDVDGNVTTFSPELLGRVHSKYGKFCWANVHTDSWEHFTQNAQLQHVLSDIDAGIELCRNTCPYFSVCGGGWPSNKLAEYDTFVATETTKCRFKIQALADLMMERLERQIGLSPASPVA